MMNHIVVVLLLFYYFVSIQDISKYTGAVNCIQHNTNSNSNDNDDSSRSESSSVHSKHNIIDNNHDDNDDNNHDDNNHDDNDDNNHDDNNDSDSKKEIIDDNSTTPPTTTRGRGTGGGTIVNCYSQLLCNQGHGYSIIDRNQTIVFMNLRLTTIGNDRSSTTTLDNNHSRVMICVSYDNNNIHKQSSSTRRSSQLSCKQNIYHDIYIINQLFNQHDIIKIHIIYYIDNIYHHYDQQSYYITQLSTSPSISQYLSITSPSLYGAIQYKRLEINFVKKQLLITTKNSSISSSHHHYNHHHHHHHSNTNDHNHHQHMNHHKHDDDNIDVDDSSDMMLFHVHGVTTSELSSSQPTIESSIYDIEPGSWFYTITPIQHIHYTATDTTWKKTTTADGIHDINNINDDDDDHDDDSTSNYHNDNDDKVDMTRTGYNSSGYIEFLLSPQEIHEQRRFADHSTRFIDSSRRFNDDLTKNKVEDGEDDRLKSALHYL